MSSVEDDGRLEERQAHIEKTRQRVALELNELADRFRPAVVKRRAEARIRAGIGAFIDGARRRPVLATSLLVSVVAAGVGVFAWKRRR